MKNLIIITLLITTSSIFSQTIEFEKVVQTDNSATKGILFDRLSSRLIEYNGGQAKYDKNIVQSDKEIGVIKFKQSMEYNPDGNRSDDGFVNYNVSVFFKDGRFKIILSDLIHEGKGISLYEITNDSEYPHAKTNFLKFRIKAWIELKEYLNIEMPKRISILENMILQPTEQEKDW
tara:strand:+ start:842 stop:1369 length:528 start_codon:yes stop_codon:yes gene_type:complete